VRGSMFPAVRRNTHSHRLRPFIGPAVIGASVVSAGDAVAGSGLHRPRRATKLRRHPPNVRHPRITLAAAVAALERLHATGTAYQTHVVVETSHEETP
jgi:hypothetical protein